MEIDDYKNHYGEDEDGENVQEQKTLAPDMIERARMQVLKLGQKRCIELAQKMQNMNAKKLIMKCLCQAIHQLEDDMDYPKM